MLSCVHTAASSQSSPAPGSRLGGLRGLPAFRTPPPNPLYPGGYGAFLRDEAAAAAVAPVCRLPPGARPMPCLLPQQQPAPPPASNDFSFLGRILGLGRPSGRPEVSPSRKEKEAARQRKRRAGETSAEAAAQRAKHAEQERNRRANETPAAAESRRRRDREARWGKEGGGQKAALRVQQLQGLVVHGDDSGSDRDVSGVGAAGTGLAGPNFPARRPWDLVPAMVQHLHWDIRRPDDPVTPSHGEYLESEATRDWPQRQQDLPAGEPLREIPFSVQVDTAVKLAHVANHHTSDSVCACCSEMKAPVEYTLVPWRSSCFQLLRADIPRTNAVIRPACTVYVRLELREEVPPPPDPVLPVGVTRRGLEQWVKAGHLLPFDQPDHPPKHSAVSGEAAGAAGPSGAAAAPAAAADTDMREGSGSGAEGREWGVGAKTFVQFSSGLGALLVCSLALRKAEQLPVPVELPLTVTGNNRCRRLPSCRTVR